MRNLLQRRPASRCSIPITKCGAMAPHGAAGVFCADCHMPLHMREGGQKFSSHWMTSPLRIRQCGPAASATFFDKNARIPRQVPRYLLCAGKDHHRQLLLKAEAASRAPTRPFAGPRCGKATSLPIMTSCFAEAREINRKGVMFWDYVSAEKMALVS